MSEAGEHIRAWQDAGLIDERLAERLLSFEEGERARERVAESDRPGLLEALLYLGIVIAGAGVVFFIGQQWDEFESWARVAILGVPAALALVAGGGMHASGEPGIRRGGHLAWLLALVLVAGTLGVAFNEFVGGDDATGSGDERGPVLFTAAITLIVALVLWSFAPTHPQVLGVTGSAVFFGEALGVWPDDYSTRIAGIVILLSGVVMVALTEAGWFRPRALSRAAGAGLLGGGAYHAGLDSAVGWEFLGLAAGCALIALGAWRASFTYITAGIVTLLVGLITFMFEHFEDEIGAPVALMISGALIIAAVLVLVQLRVLWRNRRAAA